LNSAFCLLISAFLKTSSEVELMETSSQSRQCLALGPKTSSEVELTSAIRIRGFEKPRILNPPNTFQLNVGDNT